MHLLNPIHLLIFGKLPLTDVVCPSFLVLGQFVSHDPQFPLTCLPFLSTFVEHHGLFSVKLALDIVQELYITPLNRNGKTQSLFG